MDVDVDPDADLETLLEGFGLSRTEARAYLCLLGRSPLSATAVADLTGTSRSSAYLVLRSLVDRGLVDAGTGYSSRYHAVPPAHALGALMDGERDELRARERHLERSLPRLTGLFESRAGHPEAEIVEVLRTPKLIGERFDRLQSQARSTIDIVVRGPLQVGGPNEAEIAALRRGVRARAVYDRDVLADAAVAGNLAGWSEAGEQARVYPGELPMKFALFDSHTVLMPLAAPTIAGVVALIVRNSELAASLQIVFTTLWDASRPLTAAAGDPEGAAE